MPEKDPALAEIKKFIASKKIDTAKSGWRTKLSKPVAARKFDPKKSYYWILETSKGRLQFKLLPQTAPMHVTSTIYLTEIGFYDDLTFHRVIPGFMAQGGCPLGTGSGNPGYQYDGEFDPKVKHDKPGILSMANAGPGTDGSQFFITFVPTPHLNGKHTVFGELYDGSTTLATLEMYGSSSGKPVERLAIVKATIEVK
ncbi:MAG TPA: peptidylprolyl isomerase [Planctomycetota bacterium]|nr:peptidylprolyl isomerase [Planctomycetota bacterium]